MKQMIGYGNAVYDPDVFAMLRVRKKPIVVHAVQMQVPFYVSSAGGIQDSEKEAPAGSWLIRGTKGEYYSCRDDIFKETYELACGDSDRVTFADGLEKAKEIYRSIHSGGCDIMTKGDECGCFLCQCDRERR